MAAISASLVKELREKTGAGMMDCKKALTENDGDLEAAIDWLRTKGLATAAKKAGRVASEGLVGIKTEGGKGAIVEINSETDFVARNDTFQNFVLKVADLAFETGADMEELKSVAYPGEDRTVEEQLTHLIATIGENMSLRRAATISVEPGVVASYMHNATTDGLGKIGVIVALESEADAGALEEFGRQLAMHIAAANPQALTQDDLDPELVSREREILVQQARDSGKPEDIIEKMVEGRLRKFYEESVLLSQVYVIDGENRVEKALEAKSKELGKPIKVAAFVRFGLGEGLEKKEEDFAAEVAAATQG
ncbi:MAG: translation elongation factor Ts [Alphaproteobacteria bacterium]|nr:translation elongation factor Ts [Alphaproteobacteria bacterium]